MLTERTLLRRRKSRRFGRSVRAVLAGKASGFVQNCRGVGRRRRLTKEQAAVRQLRADNAEQNATARQHAKATTNPKKLRRFVRRMERQHATA